MDPTIKAVMTQTTQWKRLTSKNGAGDRSYDTAVPINCYIVGGSWEIKNFEGEETRADTKIFVDGADFGANLPAEGDMFTDDLGKSRPLQKVARYYYPTTGIDVMEVFL